MVRHQLPLHGARTDARIRPFTLASRKPIEEYEEAKSARLSDPPGAGRSGHVSQARQEQRCRRFDPLSLLDRLLPVYVEVLRELADRGAEWVQIDEPCLVLDLDIAARQALQHAYAAIAKAVPRLKIMLATYFGGLGDNLRHRAGASRRRPASRSGPRAGSDRRRRSPTLRRICVLSLGVIDGRNIWRADLAGSLDRLEPVIAEARQGPGADRAVLLAAACSDRSRAGNRARFRREELAGVLGAEARGTRHARDRRSPADGDRSRTRWQLRTAAAAARKASPRDSRCEASPARIAGDRRRHAPPRQRIRRTRQRAATRASTCRPSRPRPSARFPQTAEVRNARAAHAKGALTRRAIRAVPAGRDGARRALAGEDRPRRARAWRVRAQRHGAVFRRAACRASPSPGTAGCNPTDRATSGRRSCSATSRARSR